MGPAVLKLSPPVLHPADKRAKELVDIRAGLRHVPQVDASAAEPVPSPDPAAQLFQYEDGEDRISVSRSGLNDIIAHFSKNV